MNELTAISIRIGIRFLGDLLIAIDCFVICLLMIMARRLFTVEKLRRLMYSFSMLFLAGGFSHVSNLMIRVPRPWLQAVSTLATGIMSVVAGFALLNLLLGYQGAIQSFYQSLMKDDDVG